MYTNTLREMRAASGVWRGSPKLTTNSSPGISSSIRSDLRTFDRHLRLPEGDFFDGVSGEFVSDSTNFWYLTPHWVSFPQAVRHARSRG